MMAISKINELFENENTVYIFDVDGVLTPLEFGEFNHYNLNDEEWAKSLESKDYYAECVAISRMQQFLNSKSPERVFVATRVMNEIELEQKKGFLKKNYNILPEHVFSVLENHEKLSIIRKVQQQFPNLEEKYFVMIDDTVEVLNYIMDHSNFSTVHISSFLK